MVTEGERVKRKRGGSRADSHRGPAAGPWRWLTGEGKWAAWWWRRGSLTQLYLQQLQKSHTCENVHILTHTHTQRRYCDVGGHLPSWWLPPCWRGSSPRGHFLCDCHECSPSIARQNVVPTPADMYRYCKNSKPTPLKSIGFQFKSWFQWSAMTRKGWHVIKTSSCVSVVVRAVSRETSFCFFSKEWELSVSM